MMVSTRVMLVSLNVSIYECLPLAVNGEPSASTATAFELIPASYHLLGPNICLRSGLDRGSECESTGAPIAAHAAFHTIDRAAQEDSVLLWKEVCSNKLLAKVDLVLFLNKCDILESKLRSGVRLSKYVRSFGERPNDPDVAQKCQ